MHGLGDNGFGGLGGDYVEIHRNTFLGTNHHNYELRGLPVNYSQFDFNASLRSEADAVNFNLCANVCVGGPVYATPIAIFGNQFELPDPPVGLGPASLGVGDFDGDGDDDLFLATGTAWYYSLAGAREWRFLSAKTDTVDQLLFGDFDGDGRTDVVTLRNGQFLVSWGGVSDWEVLNPDPTGGRLLLLPSAITAMAVGDFDGDGRADIFWADGQTWWVSYGGNTPFVAVNTSSFLRKDLLFGDFDGDGKTDVFGVVSNGMFNTWSYSRSATGAWADGYLRPALTNTVDGLVVGDFAGTGRGVSVAMSCDSLATPGCWQVSAGGIQNWHPYTLGSGPVVLAAVGHFLGRVDAYQNPLPVDLLFWNAAQPVPLVTIAMCDSSVGVGTELCLSVGGIFPSFRYTSQDMR